MPFVGWGDGFLDYDNDGWKDMMMVNGHVYPQVDQHDWGTTFAERPLLFHNLHNGKFEYVPPVKGSGLAVLTSGRGAAFGDLFNDGKIDVVINPIDGPPVLLRNVNPDHHHWVELKLVGGAEEPARCGGSHRLSDRQRHAPARGCDERRQLHLVERPAAALRPGRCDRRGNSGDSLAVGAKETVKLPAVDRIFTITEGKGITGVLCGRQPCLQRSRRQANPRARL